jgi:hypothetical protein
MDYNNTSNALSMNGLSANDVSNQQLEDEINANTLAIQLINSDISQIPINTANISTNSNNIQTNTSNVSTNTSNISSNTTNVSTNSSNITGNQISISNNSGQIDTNVINIATNSSDISTNSNNIQTNTSNISTNTSNISSNTTAIANIESNHSNDMFLAPCLYPTAFNTDYFQLYMQQSINISSNDMMVYSVMSYKYKMAKWVFIFDATNFQPASCWITIQMKQKGNASVITTGQAHLQKFQFESSSIIIPTVYTTDIQHNVQVESHVTISPYQNSGSLNMQAEFIVYPYVYRLWN